MADCLVSADVAFVEVLTLAGPPKIARGVLKERVVALVGAGETVDLRAIKTRRVV